MMNNNHLKKTISPSNKTYLAMPSKSRKNKVLNPLTGRWVLKNGKKGQEIVTKQKQQIKILNPFTGRWIFKDGIKGRDRVKMKLK